MPDRIVSAMLAHETHSLLQRSSVSQPFSLHMPMVPAAALDRRALTAIEAHLAASRRDLEDEARRYLAWLHSEAGQAAEAAEAQRRMSRLKLRFHDLLTHFDLFADALTQRSEHRVGVWLAGLEVAGADMLRVPHGLFAVPPLVCYLDRGAGAAIRRVGSRLPGGGNTPVAVVRIPRGRMISSGLAGSLAHEVGHQAAAFLGLVETLRAQTRPRFGEQHRGIDPWPYLDRWSSEILADFWALGRVGVAHTLGLIALLTMPAPLVIRGGLHRPHPIPWFRVKVSCAMGQALWDHPQWRRIADIWERLYPRAAMPGPRRRLLEALEAALPDHVATLMSLRPTSLRGASLGELMTTPRLHPDALADELAARFHRGGPGLAGLRGIPPGRAFAVIGQARADAAISPEEESALLAELLIHWARERSRLIIHRHESMTSNQGTSHERQDHRSIPA